MMEPESIKSLRCELRASQILASAALALWRPHVFLTYVYDLRVTLISHVS